jgi:hypothetical protein
MPWYINLIIVILVCALIAFGVTRLRRRLLSLWKEVTEKEIVFHKQLEMVTALFYVNREILKTEENNDFIKIVTRYRKKRLRSILLSTRQKLFNAINVIYDEIEVLELPELDEMKKEYDLLQKVRRVYNTQVLIYNQTISVFPTRYLALRMNLEIREYFG